MKLVIAIVQDEDVDDLLNGLRTARFGATHIGSSGGLLRAGNSTVLIGVPAVQVDAVRAIIRQHCRRRTQFAPPPTPALEPGLFAMPESFEVEVGGAIVFIRPIERFEQL
ncbi:MAG: cyclic-di-AMP receptor [Chloroflexota bacterium]|nr:cyclic-di-AMP receptor [Chloroflexota bacterium]